MNANKNDKNVNFQLFHHRVLWEHWQRWDALWRQQTHHPGFPTGVTIDSILLLLIIIIIITISRYLAPPSSTSRPTRTDSQPRHCPPSPLAVPCSKETGASKFSNFPGKKLPEMPTFGWRKIRLKTNLSGTIPDQTWPTERLPRQALSIRWPQLSWEPKKYINTFYPLDIHDFIWNELFLWDLISGWSEPLFSARKCLFRTNRCGSQPRKTGESP